MDEGRHREYLDGFAGVEADLAAYRKRYETYTAMLSDIHALDMDELEKRRLEESLRYRIAELEAADLKAGEQDELSARRELLRNAGKLTEALDASYDALYGARGSAAEQVGDAAVTAERAAALVPELNGVVVQIDEARHLIEDAAERLRDFRESLDFSPEEYDALETRLALIRRLGKKFGTYQKQTRAAAEAISAKRKEAAAVLQKRIEEGLKELNMPSVRFEAEILPVGGEPGFDGSGCDEVRFLMSANAGEAPGRISRIASGGELARIMLVMKDVLSERDAVQTMVFDEIDEGVSGVAAQRVGEKLARLSGNKQVICVTHLPQIAAMADGHFRIEKTERNGRTFTAITFLDGEGRTRELARLHGGENITPITLASAKEQLEAAEQYKAGYRKGQQK